MQAMTFKQGQSGNPAGKKAGTSNRLTQTFRDAVMFVYRDIGGHEAFSEWAKANPTDFYKIAARLIPVQIQRGSGAPVINFVMAAVEAPKLPIVIQPDVPRLTVSAWPNPSEGAQEIPKMPNKNG